MKANDKTKSGSRLARCSSVMLLALAGAFPLLAGAAPITIIGGFTSFFGPVASVGAGHAFFGSIETKVNGTVIFATEALPGGQFGFDNFGIGLPDPVDLRDTNGDGIGTVDFRRNFTGVGTGPNIISFTPNNGVDVQRGVAFKAGTFTLTNGSWFGNSPGSTFFPDTFIDFTLRTVSTDPTLARHMFTDTIRFVVTSPVDATLPPRADADIFSFMHTLENFSIELGSMKVYEALDLNGNPVPQGNIGQIDLIMKIGSLIPVAFSNPTGGAFIEGGVQQVPVPSSILLMLGVLGVLGVFRSPAGWSRLKRQ